VRRAGTTLLAAALAFATAGCAGLPERGPVVPAGRVEAPRVQLFANPPSAGDTPEGVVKGFFAAGRDFQQNHAVARQYLADGGSTWQSLAPVVVLEQEPCLQLVSVDDVPVAGADDTTACTVVPGVRTEPAPKSPRPRDGQTATVRVSGKVQARIDELGRYQAEAGSARYRRDLELIAKAGEWRIIGPPNGLVLTPGELGYTFSPVLLYFPQRLVDADQDGDGTGAPTDPAPASTWLVPDRRWFPSDLEPSSVASMAVRALLQKPSQWLGAAVDTGAARGVTLPPLDAVRITDGVARIELSKAPPDRRLFHAQVLATLRSLSAGPGGVPVTDVTFTVAQVALEVQAGPVPAVWPAAADDPPQSGLGQRGGVDSAAPLCLTTRGQVGQLKVAQESSCVARPELAELTRRAAASVPASDRRGSLFAVLTADRDAVWATTPGAREAAAVLRGRQLTAPSVDGTGNPGRGWIWAASSVPGGPLLASTLEPRRQVTVDVPWLAGGSITAVRISPEGSRALLVVRRGRRTEVLVSGVERAVGGQPLRLVKGPPLSLVPDLVSATDAVWLGTDSVALLGARAEKPQQAFVWTAEVGGEFEELVVASVPGRAHEGLAVSASSVDIYVRVRTARGRGALGASGGVWTLLAVQALAMPG
jgi:hypothetical protein